MNPSASAIVAIGSYVAKMADGWATSDAGILSDYNALVIQNPNEQSTIPKPYTVHDVLGCITESFGNIRALPYLPTIMDAINTGNTAACLAWLALLAGGSPAAITTGEASAINAVLTATHPDPAWPAMISQSQVDMGRLADLHDIESARATFA